MHLLQQKKKYQADHQIRVEAFEKDVQLSDRCCGESGTFAVARADIAAQVKFRKEKELKQAINQLVGHDKVQAGEVKMLTSCPACQQGLSRYGEATGLDVDYIVVELAKHKLGENWQKDFISSANNGGVEKVLL